jgi:hypothetical protein
MVAGRRHSSHKGVAQIFLRVPDRACWPPVTDTKPRGPREIWSDWMAANEAGDRDRAGSLAEELTRSVPDSFHVWFEAGLHSKGVRDWTICAERNTRALDLFTPQIAEDFDGVNPAAWNLGIAATALGDWSAARQAWTAYGITELEPGNAPIDVNSGRYRSA